MRALTTTIRKGIAGMAILFALQSNAQTIHTAADLSKNSNDPAQGTSTSDGTTLFCAENTGFTLTSTTQDAAGTAYVSYNWQEIQTSGSAGAVANGAPDGTNPNKLVITAATPGWHTYQVVASVGAASCPADPVIFTVYVLPKLTITAKTTKPDASSVTFCAQTGAPTGVNAITFNSTPAFDVTPQALPGLPTLAVSDFELAYKWYKVDNTSGTRTAVGTNTTSYTVDDPADATATAVKQYRYEVEVAYAAKTCGTYKNTATLNDGTTTAVITITPKPGKPTITIQ
jgi:hypothetical protein